MPRKKKEEMSIAEAKEYKANNKGRWPVAKVKKIQDALQRDHENQKKLRLMERKKNNAVLMRQKVDIWLDEFVRNGGNATKAAQTAFGIESRSVAATIGSKYMKQAQELNRLIMEDQTMTITELMKIAIEKARNDDDPRWWDRLMKLGGYHDFMAKEKKESSPVVNIIATEKDILSRYSDEPIDGEILDDTEGY